MAVPHQADSDAELIVRAYNGDKDAFGDLYERYLRQIYRYVYYRVADSVDAEDLTEAVFIKAWEAFPRIRLGGFNFKSWIYRIAHNEVIDRYRTHRKTNSIDEAAEIRDPSGNPEAVYQDQEASVLLAKAISSLDDSYQEVLIYRFIQGYSHQETAELMGRSVVHVRVLQHRALLKLKERLDKETIGNG